MVGKPVYLDTEPSLMACEDAPQMTSLAFVLQERDKRFVRRCAPSKNYALWRHRPEQVQLKTVSGAARRCIEKAISLTPIFVSMMLLIHCTVQEDYHLTEQELLMMPLLNAAEAGDVHQVQLLLDHGANIEERNYYGLTALHRASEEGRLQVVKLLLARGADLNAMDCDGGRALEKAAQQGHGRTVALLAAWGAQLAYRDAMGCTLLMRAAGTDSRKCSLECLYIVDGLGH